MQTNTPVWSRTEKANTKWCLPIGKSPLLRDNWLSWKASLPSLSVFLSLAVAADLQAVPFEDYLACENYYQGFLHMQSMECLAEMAHLLYPKLSDKACLEKAELLSVFYWFASVKANFTRMFPHFFTNIPQEKSNLLGSADLGVGEELRQAMNAQIRALTGGDITKEAAILQMDCWRALTELDAKAQEAQELRNQLK